jgi:hypothetical protein
MAVRLLARDGISVGEAKTYSPLPEKDAMEPPLRALETRLDGLERALSPNAGAPAMEPESATRFVLRIRLDMLADELPRNLSPGKIGRAYGGIPAEVARTLSDALPELERLVAATRSLLEMKGANP